MKWSYIAHLRKVRSVSSLLCAVILLGVLVVPHTPLVDNGFKAPLPYDVDNKHAYRQYSPPSRPEVDCASVPCLALTFDDGPDTVNTPRVLDVLKSRGVKATFFVVGINAAAHPDTVRRMHQEGHEVSNHSWNHADFTTLTPAQIREQIISTQIAVMSAGVPAPRWFRPPYGAMNPQVRAHVPLALALWNVDPEDWGNKDPKVVAEKILAHTGPGRVVDLHDMHAVTAEAIPIVIDTLRPNYHFVTMSDLFDATAGQRGEYYGR